MADYSKYANADGCGWPTGTAGSGPSICGRPAKARTDSSIVPNGRVCGRHASSAVRRGWTAEPLSATNEETK